MLTQTRGNLAMRLFTWMAVGLIGVACFLAQNAAAGYPDGMNTYAAYHVMHGGVDPSGLSPKVWTGSGINNWRGGSFNDYVASTLSLTPDEAFISKVGTNPPYSPGGAAAASGGKFAKGIASEGVLDYEAEQMARSRTAGEFCRSDGKPTKVTVFLIAPKTTTIPETPSSCCCDISVNIYFSPWDSVPNQKWTVKKWLFGHPDRFERYWKKRAVNGFVESINTNFTPGYAGTGSYPHHQLSAFVGNNGELKNQKLWNIMDAEQMAQSFIAGSGSDYVFVGHSQGANILMHVLNHVCNKGGIGVDSDGQLDK